MNSSIKNKSRKKLSVKLSIMSIIALSLILITSGSFFPSANGQTENCHNLESNNAIPVLLIHGWNEGEGGFLPIHFDEWQQRLNQDKIPFCIISFEQSSDACGSSADHAKELAQIVQNIKSKTGQKQVNIIGYSKGGLDARVYLANDLSNKDVANLIMVGTPNDGSPIASSAQFLPEAFRICSPAIDDLAEDSTATKAQINSNTNYYTIGGHWIPNFVFFNCSPLLFNWLALGSFNIIGEDDGVVPLDSAIDPEEDFENIDISHSCHLDLLGNEEYDMVKKEGILLQ
jgi:pimeloyl-ACP methyl ester carboxylesterase